MKFRAILNDSYDLENTEGFILKDWHKTVIYFIVIAVVLNILAVIYIKAGKFIYFWDDATYWDISRRIAAGEISGGFWRSVYNSVAERDYNYIAALPSAALAVVFGNSRLTYILGLVNMYLLPSYIMIYHIAKKLSKAPKLTTVIVALLFPSLIFLTFIGFVDVGAFLICLICLNLYFPDNKKKRQAPVKYVILGALLVFAMLWRRYFAFFAVSFITAMIADCVLFKRKWYNTALTIITAAAILGLFFRDFVVYKLMADYGNMYSGYKFAVSTDFKLITRYFGLLFIAVLAVSSVALGVKKRESRTFFLWLQLIVCLVMFISTQTHGQQHLLLYLPSLIMLTVIIIRYISKEWMLLAIAGLAVLHAVFVYIPREQPSNIQEIKHMALIPDFSMLPHSRDDAEEILALKRRLDTTVYDGDNLGVLASSFTINEDILKNVEASLGVKPIRDNYIVSLPQVDSRDRDLSPLYSVNYILAAYPAQTHLAEGSQTVVTEAVRSFENYADIATAYEEVPDFEYEIDGITFRLYHRVRDELPKDMREFELRLYRQ